MTFILSHSFYEAHRIGYFLYLKTEAQPASEMQCFIQNLTINKVQQKKITSGSHTPSSKPYSVEIS
jgi:hypothetical protein